MNSASHRGRWSVLTVLMCSSACLHACQSEYRSYTENVVATFAAGEYAAAEKWALTAESGIPPNHQDRVVYVLEAARTAQAAGNFRKSIRLFDQAYDALEPYLDEKAEAGAAEGAASTLINPTVEKYKATPCERMMASALNAVNFLALGDAENARIELNRAVAWQQDAIERYAAAIEARNRANEKAAERHRIGATNDAVMQHVAPWFRNIENLRGYADYAAPFVNHLRGVCLLTLGADAADRHAARHEFRLVAGMEPASHAVVGLDIADAERADAALPPTTWVYFFTGLAPRLEEFKTPPIPVPIAGGWTTVTAAVPIMRLYEDAAEPLRIRGGDAEASTVLLTDAERIVAEQFKARLPIVVTQAVLSAALKSTGTYFARQSGGDLAFLLAVIVQYASTSADTRSWRTLPGRIGVARIPTPPDGRLTFTAAGRGIGGCEVTPHICNIALVTLPASRTPAASIISIPLAGRALAHSAITSDGSTP